MTTSIRQHTITQQCLAWLVHAFTGIGAIIGVYAINAIYQGEFIIALWMMGAAIIVDAVDGTFARWLDVKNVLPDFDGELLDNIIDYFNYVLVPAIFILMSHICEGAMAPLAAALITLASCYQFCQNDAKTDDHFFKGFPSFWNIVVFYLFFLQTSSSLNFIVLMILVGLVFVPVKYIYPSRLEYLTQSRILQLGMLIATIVWGAATLGLLAIFPQQSWVLMFISVAYIILYFVASLYRTFNPLR